MVVEGILASLPAWMALGWLWVLRVTEVLARCCFVVGVVLAGVE